MSRLIIKNIPSYITPSSLQDHFQSKKGPGGTLTDVKVALKPDGTSGRFAFVGYKTEQEANAAREWFERSFIGSSRISVGVVEVSTFSFYWGFSFAHLVFRESFGIGYKGCSCSPT